MNMKISKKDIKLLLYTGGIALLVIVYFAFYRDISKKSEEMENRIAVLEEEKNQLEILDNNKDKYKKNTETMQREIDMILAGFPADIREEDAIVYGNQLENLSSMEISGISIGSKNLLYSSGQEIENAEAIQAEKSTQDTQTEVQNTEDTQNMETTANEEGSGLHLYGMPINYNFTVDYDSLKKAAELIGGNKDKRNMEAITLSFDSESGKLIGTATVNMYFVLGSDNIYQKPVVSPMRQGVDDIFGTIGNTQQSEE